MVGTETAPDLAQYLPKEIFGRLLTSTPLTYGLSGARVFAVETESGKFVLRIPSDKEDASQYLSVLQQASDNSIAPKLKHFDPATGATVSQAIYGEPFGRVFANPTTRPAAVQSIIYLIRKTHELPTANTIISDPIGRARDVWSEQSVRAGFPDWALPLASVIGEAQQALNRDPRLVLSHNDVNPANILWDGDRAWLIDWYVTGQNHPYYDVAAFCVFFELPNEVSVSLLELQEQTKLSEAQLALFESIRRLIAVFCASIIFKLVPDLSAMPAFSLAEAPTLMQAYQSIATGKLSPQSPQFQYMMSVALLRQATTQAT